MSRDRKSIIPSFKEVLLNANYLQITYNNYLNSAFDAKGSASVIFVKETKDLFHSIERGSLSRPNGESFSFHNHYSYTFKSGSVVLAQRRRALPVELCELYPSKNSLVSSHPYSCKDDLYFCKIKLRPKGFSLTWEIKGPRKSERISCFYDQVI